MSINDLEIMKEKTIKQIYNETYWDIVHRSKFTFKKINTIYKLIKFKKGTLLDCGCGEGYLLRFFNEIGYKCYGFDLSEKAVKTTSGEGLTVIKGDLEEKIPFNKKFDIIICSDILEHIYNIESPIANMKSALKEDGILVISIPNDFTIFHRIKILFGIIYYEIYSSHLHYFTQKQFRKILKENGLKIVKEKNISVNIPILNPILDVMANVLPKLFAQSYIFVTLKKVPS